MEFQASNLTLTYYLVVFRFCKWKFYYEELHDGYPIYGKRWNKQYFYTQRNGWATGNDFVTLFLKNYIYMLLDSKDLGFYVFRTLMCIVGKP